MSTSLSTTSPVRRRRRIVHRHTANETRRRALAAARKLLLAHGPTSVTLQGVADRLGHSHSNISHHFGSAEELQAALMSVMVEELSFALANAMSALESSESRTGMLVDAVFDTFDRGAAGVLAAWLVLSNKQRYLEPVREAVAHLTRGVNERLAQELPGRPLSISSALLFLTLCAFGDALIGTNLCRMLRIDRAAMRRLAVQFIPDFV